MDRGKTFAFLVGIESYAAGRNWSLDGPASDILRVVDWLLASGVQKEQIRVLLSTLDRNSHIGQTIHARLGVEPGRTTAESVRREIEALRSISAELFLFYWGGHGWSSGGRERRLFCEDATLQTYANLNLDSVLLSMQTDWYRRIGKQVFIVDACANFTFQPGRGTPDYVFGGGAPLTSIDQFQLYASRPGEASKNDDASKTGMFTNELLAALGPPQLEGAWPPDFIRIGDQLNNRFEALRNEGRTQQIPSRVHFYDSATGRGSFNQTAPLQQLQDFFSAAIDGDVDVQEHRMSRARAWYIRSLRYVPAATDVDRNPADRTIAQLLHALADWRHQPRGDLPLLTFAEGWTKEVLKEPQQLTQLRHLTSACALERGLSEIDIERARLLLREEATRRPEALQVFFRPEHKDLTTQASEITFDVTLYLWFGASKPDEWGGRALLGRREGVTLVQAEAFVNEQLMTNLADSPPDLIEFFVPFGFANRSYDEWSFRRDAAIPVGSPLGSEFQVVLRSYDRAISAGLLEKSKQRWPFGSSRDGVADEIVAIRWLESAEQDAKQLFNVLRAGQCAPCVVLSAPSDANIHSLWEASVWAGITIGMWLRRGEGAGSNSCEELSKLLAGKSAEPLPHQASLRDLPKRVFQHRQSETYPALTLYWDDPHRLPEAVQQVSPKTQR